MKIQPKFLLQICVCIFISFNLSNQFCTDADPLCLACDPLSRFCILCADGYLNHENKCQKSHNKVDFCFSYEGEGKCRVCQYGYYLTELGICEEIEDEECIIYNLDTKQCTVCKDNKLPNEKGECDKKEECNLPNCQYCLARGETPNCVECDKGYTIFYEGGIATCVQETPSVTNCNTVYTHDNLKCFLCDAPYYNMNGSCFLSDSYAISKNVSKIYMSIIMALLFLII